MRSAYVFCLFSCCLSACSGISVNQDYDAATLDRFPRYQTFDWFPGGHETKGDGQIDDPFIDKRVRTAVIADLSTRSFEKIEQQTPKATSLVVGLRPTTPTRLSS